MHAEDSSGVNASCTYELQGQRHHAQREGAILRTCFVANRDSISLLEVIDFVVTRKNLWALSIRLVVNERHAIYHPFLA